MEKYQIIKELGRGSFGIVWKAINTETSEVVAIKKIKSKCYSLGEVKSLRRMNHLNIVKLKEAIMEDGTLFLVFEYMDSNLHQVMTHRKTLFSESQVRNWLFQVLQGLAHMHHRGYFHRDLKPENLLVSKNVIKIADLGSARETYSRPPYTDYVTTRWYRAPEVLLKSPLYNSAVDMWAMGAIMAELFTLSPLFPGSSEADQIYKICSVLGTPTWSDWPGGLVLANFVKYQFPQLGGVHLSDMIPAASKDAIDLIYSLCSWDPLKRPTASQSLQHPFFHSCYYIPRSLLVREATLMDRKFSDVKQVHKRTVTKKNNVPSITSMQPPIGDDPASIYFDIIERGLSETAEKLEDTEIMFSRVRAQLPFPKPEYDYGRNCEQEVLRKLELNIEDAFKNEYSGTTLDTRNCAPDLLRRLELNIEDALTKEYAGTKPDPRPERNCAPDLLRRLELNIEDALTKEYAGTKPNPRPERKCAPELLRRLELNIEDALTKEYAGTKPNPRPERKCAPELLRRLELNIEDALTKEYAGTKPNPRPERKCAPELLRRLELNIEDAIKNEYSGTKSNPKTERSCAPEVLCRLEMNIEDAINSEYSWTTSNRRPTRNCAPDLLRRLEMNIEDAIKYEYPGTTSTPRHATNCASELLRRFELNIEDEYSQIAT